MARATFVKKAQKDIYLRGKRVQYVSQKGKNEGKTLTKVDRSIPADDNDVILVNKGESYYWWQFMNGSMNVSKTAPKASQLTQSSYLSTLYSIQERINEFSCDTAEDFTQAVEDFKSEAEELRDETQEKLDNMPESLTYSPTGELLQERIDSLENAISELENIDCEFEEEGDQSLEEWLEEKIGELQNVCFE